MGIEKMMLSAGDLVYWIIINTDIENSVKQCATCMKFQ